MELSIQQRDFLKALQRTQSVADRKSSMPILSNVLLSAEGPDRVRFAATDLYLGVSASCPAAIRKGGTIAIAARTLFDIVRNLPDGEVRVSANFTKAYSRYPLTIPVPYGQDVDRSIDLARRVAEQMRMDEPYRALITRPFRVLGVDSYGTSGVEVAFYVETLPGEQWVVGRELRRRLAKAFAEEGLSFTA